MTSTARSLAILQLFGPAAPALTAQDIAARLGVTLSTAYRDIANLRALGLIEAYGGESFILGGGLSVLDRMARSLDPIIAAALPEMQALAAETGLTLTLTRLYGDRLLAVENVRGTRDISIGYARGELLPLFRGCSGKAILGALDWRKLKSVYTACAPDIAQAGLGADWPTFRATARAFGKTPAVWTAGELRPENIALAVPLQAKVTPVTASITIILRADAADVPAREVLETALLAARDRVVARLDGV